MATGVNRVTLVGYLGQDPETRYLQNGDAVTNINVATSEKWTDKGTGEVKEKTEWHRIVMWRRLAEVAAEYLRKGSLVYIEGKLQTRKWTDKDDNDRWTTEIVANQMQMLGGKGNGGSKSEPREPPSSTSSQKATTDDFDDDIPF